MGRIKTTNIKTLGNEIIKDHASRFTEDFGKNKKILDEIKLIKSKKIRNILAGYITKETKKIKKSGL
jgi:small subunit ribosomal protein S17e